MKYYSYKLIFSSKVHTSHYWSIFNLTIGQSIDHKTELLHLFFNYILLNSAGIIIIYYYDIYNTAKNTVPTNVFILTNEHLLNTCVKPIF